MRISKVKLYKHSQHVEHPSISREYTANGSQSRVAQNVLVCSLTISSRNCFTLPAWHFSLCLVMPKKGSKRAAATDPQRLSDMRRGSYGTARCTEKLMKIARDEGIPNAISRTSHWRARKALTTSNDIYGPLVQDFVPHHWITKVIEKLLLLHLFWYQPKLEEVSS